MDGARRGVTHRLLLIGSRRAHILCSSVAIGPSLPSLPESSESCHPRMSARCHLCPCEIYLLPPEEGHLS